MNILEHACLFILVGEDLVFNSNGGQYVVWVEQQGGLTSDE